VQYLLSETNFFMMEVNRPGMEFAKAMADQKVIIGRVLAGLADQSSRDGRDTGGDEQV